MQLQLAGDKAAVVLSSLCVVHCLLTPILVIALPSMSAVLWLSHESFHTTLLCFVLPVGLLALTLGFWHHRHWRPYLSGICGLLLLTAIALFGHQLVSDTTETFATVLASALIIYAHIGNYRLRQQLNRAKASEC